MISHCEFKFLNRIQYPVLIYFFFLFSCMFLTACDKESIDEIKPEPPVEEVSSPYGIIAHRGYWDSANPQNSLAALKRALKLNIYGTEMDIHQTKDGLIVVNHDATYYDLPISKSTYEELSRQTLNNGEPLPLLETFLQAKKTIQGTVKLIIELKSCNVNDLVKLVDSYGLQDDVEYISFSTSLCDQLVKLGYGYKTYYLRGNMTPADIKEKGYGGIDYNCSVFDTNPHWIKESQDLGLKRIVWTVNDIQLIKRYIQQGLLVTTDNVIETINRN